MNKKTKVINVIFVDDHQMFLEGLQLLLKKENKINIVAIVKNAFEAINIIRTNVVDVVITDYDMPKLNGIELGNILKIEKEDIKIILLTSFSNNKVIIEAIKYKVEGYLIKNIGITELLVAIKTVNEGKKYFSEEIKIKYDKNLFSNKNSQVVNLSSREKEVLKLIVKEKKTHEIADLLFISFNTVESHRKNLMKKIGTNNMIGLFKFTLENSLT